jgi:hypothetical protein
MGRVRPTTAARRRFDEVVDQSGHTITAVLSQALNNVLRRSESAMRFLLGRAGSLRRPSSSLASVKCNVGAVTSP